MLDNLSMASPAIQLAAVVISYIIGIMQKISDLFTFATGVEVNTD